MANRPVFMSREDKLYQENIEFKWHSGFSVGQKRKSVEELHREFNKQYPGKNVLEVSNASLHPLSGELSVDTLRNEDGGVSSILLGSQMFVKGGPFPSMYVKSLEEVKKDPQLKKSGKLIAYNYKEGTFRVHDNNKFFHWVIVNVLYTRPDLAEKVIKFDGFTDINYNPNKPSDSLAESLSIFKMLSETGRLDYAMQNGRTFNIAVYGTNKL